ncbi:MAG: ImmA/IrrE family metallo-endopeptidase [Planctomicrobium sp.]|jgi:Zn-dependent peptidase ImmA (M78 family)|nr:ImmA/IrrE family metallo-endopeptidase [Planctomicrobium sp.]
MSEFAASYLHLESKELVDHLLNAAGQKEQPQVNPHDLLEFLKLQYMSVDFATELAPVARETFDGITPRAMISFHDRLIASDQSLSENRTRFSVLHEIGHYILPQHQNSLYVCDEVDMSFRTHLTYEQEANRVAADLLFLGERFEMEANSRPVTASTVKLLAGQFGASFEATGRRMVERSYRPYLFVSFTDGSNWGGNCGAEPQWKIRYCIPSPSFSNRYFQKLTQGIVPTEVWAKISTPGRDLDQSETLTVQISCVTDAQPLPFHAEYFYNRYNVFCFLRPET